MAADLTYQPKVVQIRQDGNLAVPTGQLINVESGGHIQYGGSTIDNNVKGLVYTVTLAPAAGAANIDLTTITFKDETGTAVAYPVTFLWWLSDAATGIGLTATTASGAVAAGASGTDLVAHVAKKLTLSQSTAAGVYIASITDTAKTGFYVAVQPLNSDMQVQVSAQLVAGNYG